MGLPLAVEQSQKAHEKHLRPTLCESGGEKVFTLDENALFSRQTQPQLPANQAQQQSVYSLQANDTCVFV